MNSQQTMADPQRRLQLNLERENPNATLNDQEENIIHDMLYDERELLDRLDREIQLGPSEQTLASLYEQRKVCATRISRYAIALAPHRRLPPELLTKVFLESRDGEQTVLPPGPTESPWGFRWVCSRWRQVALAENQSFWNDLYVVGSGNNTPVGVAIICLPWVWSQTGTSPLSLRLDSSCYDERTHRENRILRDTLAPYVHRIQNISLYTGPQHLPIMLSSRSHPFSSLASLTLTFQFKPNSQCPEHLLKEDRAVTLFSASINLRKITIIGTTPFDNAVNLSVFHHIPWGQLTHLNFCHVGLPGEEFEWMLRKCNSLTSLELPWVQEWLNPPSLEIILPHLRSLTVRMMHRTPYGCIFNLLRLPSLRELSINDTSSDANLFGCRPELINMINRSGARIESLHLFNTGILTFQSLLPELPDLVTLVLSLSTPVTNRTFQKMMLGEILPRLEHLRCFGCPISLLQFLQYRRLSSAEISYYTSTPMEELVEIEGICEGLNLDLEKDGQCVTFDMLYDEIEEEFVPTGLLATLVSRD